MDGYLIDVIGQLHRPGGALASQNVDLSPETWRHFFLDMANLHDPIAAAITLGGSSSVMRADKTSKGYERYRLVLYQKLAAKRCTIINTSTERLDQELDEEALSFLRSIKATLPGQTIFTSEYERLGLGPGVTQVGDIVVCLYGATSPFILRPWRGYWRVVGECYMYEFTEFGDVDARTKFGRSTQTCFASSDGVDGYFGPHD
jgi:hypothetical protein